MFEFAWMQDPSAIVVTGRACHRGAFVARERRTCSRRFKFQSPATFRVSAHHLMAGSIRRRHRSVLDRSEGP